MSEGPYDFQIVIIGLVAFVAICVAFIAGVRSKSGAAQ